MFCKSELCLLFRFPKTHFLLCTPMLTTPHHHNSFTLCCLSSISFSLYHSLSLSFSLSLSLHHPLSILRHLSWSLDFLLSTFPFPHLWLSSDTGGDFLGGWSQEGCRDVTPTSLEKTKTRQCQSNHLTNFALLLVRLWEFSYNAYVSDEGFSSQLWVSPPRASPQARLLYQKSRTVAFL